MANNECKFGIGDPVWAKMKGFSPWPGKIDLPSEGMKRPAIKKNMHCVYFFGTHDFAWILEADMKPYDEFKMALSKNKKSVNFIQAIDEMENYLKSRGAVIEGNPVKDAEFDALFASSKCESGAAGANEQKTAAAKISLKKRGLTAAADVAAARDGSAAASGDAAVANGQPIVKKAKGSPRKKDGKTEDLSAMTPASSPSGRESSPARCGSSPLHLSNGSAAPAKKSASSAVTSILERPTAMIRPASPSLETSPSSKTLKLKDIEPSTLSFGFLGLGIMGSGIVKNLLNSGHRVTVWNRSNDKCEEFLKAGARSVLTPADVIADCDVTFSCVSDPQAAKDMVFGNCGVLPEINTTKGYVEMTGIDADTSQDISEAISLKGGRYLEAQMQGSKDQANDGSLVLLVAGDRSLFDDGQSCFQAMGKNSFYVGEVGNASKMNLVLQLMAGVTLAGLAEGMALADRAGLQQKDILEVLQLTGLHCPLILKKGQAIIEGGFATHHPLQHMQKDLRLSLSLGDALEQPLPLTASANEVFKHAKRLGYGEHDTSAVYIRARF